jgi:hypothetical protein
MVRLDADIRIRRAARERHAREGDVLTAAIVGRAWRTPLGNTAMARLDASAIGFAAPRASIMRGRATC